MKVKILFFLCMVLFSELALGQEDSTTIQFDSLKINVDSLKFEVNEFRRKSDSLKHLLKERKPYVDSVKTILQEYKQPIDSIEIEQGLRKNKRKSAKNLQSSYSDTNSNQLTALFICQIFEVEKEVLGKLIETY